MEVFRTGVVLVLASSAILARGSDLTALPVSETAGRGESR
jgi:hypothetical protein